MLQSEEEKLAMERKVQIVEERAVNVIHSSQKKYVRPLGLGTRLMKNNNDYALGISTVSTCREIEAEELRRELEEARIAEKAARLQLRDTSSHLPTSNTSTTSIHDETPVTMVTVTDYIVGAHEL